eukprot:Gb_33233 [translate_table: standard]
MLTKNNLVDCSEVDAQLWPFSSCGSEALDHQENPEMLYLQLELYISICDHYHWGTLSLLDQWCLEISGNIVKAKCDPWKRDTASVSSEAPVHLPVTESSPSNKPKHEGLPPYAPYSRLFREYLYSLILWLALQLLKRYKKIVVSNSNKFAFNEPTSPESPKYSPVGP